MKLAYHALTGEKVAVKIMDKRQLGVIPDHLFVFFLFFFLIFLFYHVSHFLVLPFFTFVWCSEKSNEKSPNENFQLVLEPYCPLYTENNTFLIVQLCLLVFLL